MIAFLRGRLEDKGISSIDVDVNGVGYRVLVSNTSLSAMPFLGEPVFIYTYLYVREDLMQLFGFVSTSERDVFEKLISVSGIGPKVAMALLSSFDVDSLKQAIASEDVARITAVPGIGKKGAQRLILELKDKIAAGIVISIGSQAVLDAAALDEAISALISLGYTNSEAKKALTGFDGNGSQPSVEELIKFALKNLARQ